MPTYKRPGVYINETLAPLTQAISAPGDAVAAFVGTHSAGPNDVTLISSWSQFVSTYSGFGNGQNLLPFAVYQYFNNGGRQCYVQRAVASDAVGSSLTLADRTTPSTVTNVVATTTVATITTAAAHGLVVGSTVLIAGLTNAALNGTWVVTGIPTTTTFTFARTGTAISTGADAGTVSSLSLGISSQTVGVCSNSLYVDIVNNGLAGSGRFDIVVYNGGTAAANVVETFTNLSMDPSDPRNAVSLLNSPTVGSQWISLTSYVAGVYAVTKIPVAVSGDALTGGSDGVNTPDLVAATELLDSIEDVLVVNLPGCSDTTTLNSVAAYCQTKGTFFLVIDSPPSSSTYSATVTAYENYMPSGTGSPLAATSFAAVYGPWLVVDDPSQSTPGASRILPPGGAVLGRFISTDVNQGVQKSPAGIDIPLRGVLATDVTFLNSDLDALNVAGFNVIRSVPGAGFCVMGARTIKTGVPDQYITIRRSLMYLEKALTDLTRFAIFQPNNSDLWANLASVTNQFLTSALQVGVLKGATPSEAFYVICDDTNNTPAAVASGQVNITVGVALNTPAEFIVFTIGQYDGGTAITSQDNG